MKTIFVAGFSDLIARNLLSTDLIRSLTKNHHLRVVVLTLDFKKDYITRTLSGTGAIVEAIPDTPPSRGDARLAKLFYNLLPSQTIRIQKQANVVRTKNIFDWVVGIMLGFLGRFKGVRKLFRAADRALVRTQYFAAIFDRYEPALVFASDVQGIYDTRLMKEARRRCIRILGMVRSWDNMTSKGLMRIVPDHLAVHTETIRDEAVHYNDVDPKTISIVGIPHYDRYTTAKRAPRENVLRGYRLDSSKKTILFAPPSDLFVQNNTVNRFVLSLLGQLPQEETQIIVRFPLRGGVDLGARSPQSNIVFDYPGTRLAETNRERMELTKEEDERLADTLSAMDVVLSGPSSLAVDAALFEKPVVFIAFDGEKNRRYSESMRRFLDYDHFVPLVQSGGVKIARMPSDLLPIIAAYLKNPAADREGRARIVKEKCGVLDGRSTERLAAIIAHAI